MASTHVDVAAAEWTSGRPFYGPGAVYDARATRAGTPACASGGYTLNPTGQPHSALIANETVSLVI